MQTNEKQKDMERGRDEGRGEEGDLREVVGTAIFEESIRQIVYLIFIAIGPCIIARLLCKCATGRPSTNGIAHSHVCVCVCVCVEGSPLTMPSKRGSTWTLGCSTGQDAITK